MIDLLINLGWLVVALIATYITGSVVERRHFASLRKRERVALTVPVVTRGLVGGRVSAYESLVDRARREALLRMKGQARGALEVACTRITTSNLGPGSVEAIAYGTAVFPAGADAKFRP